MPTNNKYSSAVLTLVRPFPTWVTDADDMQRVAAYDTYDDIYKNVPATFAIAMRGTDDKPVYVPSAEKIVEATNRYLGKDWNWSISATGPDAQVAEAGRAEIELTLAALFMREELFSVFFSLKRNFLIFGDAFLHITADLAAPAGRRITIQELPARSVFWIPSPINIEKHIGVYIVDLIYADDGTTQIARRMEYRYNESGGVDARLAFFETNAWDDRWVGHPALKPVAVPIAYRDPATADLLGGITLPTSVTQIPIYHFRNRRRGGEPYGTSQIAGVETLIAAINQSASDEDVTLALQGLGAYVTDSPRPIDETTGQEVDWEITPGTVLELRAGQKFDRLDGVSTVVPFQDHLSYLDRQINESRGLSSTAVGQVDVQVAASGVALRLDMAPILAQNEEKEAELLSRLDQLTFDLLTMWLPIEQVTVPPGLRIANSFNDPLPLDRKAIVDEVLALVGGSLMSREFAIKYLTLKLGYQFPSDMLVQIVNDEDDVAARLAAEASGGALPGDDGSGNIGQLPPGSATAPTATPDQPALPAVV